MDRVTLALACVFVALAGVAGARSVLHGQRSRLTIVLMSIAFLFQFWALTVRGQMRGQCPLMDAGEIFLFLAWSQTFFYLITGAAFRLSLLGLFSTPLILVAQIIALIPGVMETNVKRVPVTDYWGELHMAVSVMAYGALALSAVAGVMALVLDRKLKTGDADSLLKTLPSISNLHASVGRLALIGWVVLTAGIIAGTVMKTSGGNAHLMVASAVWALYGALIALNYWRGIPPHQMALGSITLFTLSLGVFAVL